MWVTAIQVYSFNSRFACFDTKHEVPSPLCTLYEKGGVARLSRWKGLSVFLPDTSRPDGIVGGPGILILASDGWTGLVLYKALMLYLKIGQTANMHL